MYEKWEEGVSYGMKEKDVGEGLSYHFMGFNV